MRITKITIIPVFLSVFRQFQRRNNPNYRRQMGLAETTWFHQSATAPCRKVYRNHYVQGKPWKDVGNAFGLNRLKLYDDPSQNEIHNFNDLDQSETYMVQDQTHPNRWVRQIIESHQTHSAILSSSFSVYLVGVAPWVSSAMNAIYPFHNWCQPSAP